MCEERLRLLDLYDKAVEEFARSTSALKAATDASFEEFKDAESQARMALAKTREAKVAMLTHRREHGC